MLRILCAVLISGFVATAIAGPLCYQCKNVDDRRKCNKIIRCGDGQMCFTDKHMRGGKLLYTMSCKDISFCEKQPGEIAWTKEKLEETVVATGDDMPLCRDCCNSDLCNDIACDHISQNIVCRDHTLCKHAADNGTLECNHTEIYQYCMESCGGCHAAGFHKHPNSPVSSGPKMAAFKIADDDAEQDSVKDLPICTLFSNFYYSISAKKRAAPKPSPIFDFVKKWATVAHNSQTSQTSNESGLKKLWTKMKHTGKGLLNNGGWGATWGANSGTKDKPSEHKNKVAPHQAPQPSAIGKIVNFFQVVMNSVVQHIALSDAEDISELASSFSHSVAEGIQELAATIEIWYDSQYCGEWMSVICANTCYYDI